jgi:hypothetical protein
MSGDRCQTYRPARGDCCPTGCNILFLKLPQSLIILSSLQIAELVAERLDSSQGWLPRRQASRAA